MEIVENTTVNEEAAVFATVRSAGAADSGDWIDVGPEAGFPLDAGIAVLVGRKQIAVYRSSRMNEWFGTDNHCPHAGYAVLARGLIGDAAGEPKVACPMHKRAFSLRDGRCLGDDSLRVHVYEVRLSEGRVEVRVEPC